MNKQIIISRLKDLISEGEAVKATGKISGSGQKLTNRESFSRWQMSCLEYLAIFKGKPYLDSFKKEVKSRLSPNVERGLGILRSLNIALVKGYVPIEEEKVKKTKVDIQSKSEVTNHVLKLMKKGQIKDCQHMKVNKDLVDSYYSQCDVDLAWRQAAFSLGSILTVGGQVEYYWPNCEKDCRVYNKADDFFKSLISIEEPKGEKLEVDNYVDEERIKELASLPKDKFDTTKLVKLCEELNQNHKWKNYFAVGAVLRTILDHVPPIFKMKNFEQVANNYKWGTSNKKCILRLQKAAKDIADNLLHEQIKKIEVLPKKPRVDFKAELDILLAEIITILKS